MLRMVERRWLTGEARALGVLLSEEQANALVRLADHVEGFGAARGVTAIVDRQGILVKHVLDSLTLCRWIDAAATGRFVDVGSGAGFPGLPVAIARPQVEVVLIDSVLRKAAFLEETVAVLRLGNVRVLRERAEVVGRDVGWREAASWAAARAVGSLAESLELCAPLVAVGGVVLVMKGPAVEDEWETGAALGEALGLGGLEKAVLELPGGHRRTVVCARKVRSLPERYPRRPSQLGRAP